MQKSFLLTLLISSLVIHTTQAITAKGVVEIIAGITDDNFKRNKFIIQKDDLAEFQKCFTGAETLVPIFDDMIDDFKEGSLAGISEGLMEIQQVIMALPEKVSTCIAIQDDLTKLGQSKPINHLFNHRSVCLKTDGILWQWAEIFIEPSVFIKVVSKNLVWNYATIHSDINEAITDLNTQKYFDFGEKIGEVLVIATKQ